MIGDRRIRPEGHEALEQAGRVALLQGGDHGAVRTDGLQVFGMRDQGADRQTGGRSVRSEHGEGVAVTRADQGPGVLLRKTPVGRCLGFQRGFTGTFQMS